MKERIQKVLANAGVASRRHVEEMVEQGRIEVNGRTVRDLPVLIDPAADEVDVDGERVRFARPAKRSSASQPPTADRVYVLMNKPAGVFCTNVGQETNQGEQTRAIDLLPPAFRDRHRVYPVGRLDAESRGLLLLTNDGDLTNRLTHPRYGVPKTYRATVDGLVTAETAAALESGVWLADPQRGGAKTGRGRVRVVRRDRLRTVLEVTLKEGRNRQVRRTLAKLGHKVRDLIRVKLGPLELGTLKPGESRLLSPREVRELHEAVAATAARTAERRARTATADAAPPASRPRQGAKRTPPQSPTPAPRARATRVAPGRHPLESAR